jgi:hypothetical protein
VVDCRDGVLSPLSGPVERGYAAAVARRAPRVLSRIPYFRIERPAYSAVSPKISSIRIS